MSQILQMFGKCQKYLNFFIFDETIILGPAIYADSKLASLFKIVLEDFGCAAGFGNENIQS